MTVTLIGGEMLGWSDLDGRRGPAPARGAVLRPLLAAATGRTLVAGPHDPRLLDDLAGAEATVLVRGLADAEALAGRPGVTVCCGSLEKLAATPAYDTVLALDGLGRLHSAEAPDATWDETLTQLLAVLRPAGRLLLSVENPFGLHRLVALPRELSDSDWVAADDAHTLARLRTRLAEAGVPVVRDYAVYPEPHAPAVLLSEEALTDPALHGFVATALAATRPSGDALADPARLATGALRHDLAAALAPAWILHAGAGDPGPPALIADGVLSASTAAATTPAPPCTAPPSADTEPASAPASTGIAPVQADSAATAPVLAVSDVWAVCREADGTWNIPLGDSLEALVLAACRRRDLPAVRDLLTAWQAGAAAGVPADRVVVGDDGRHHGLVPAGEPLAALRALAATLIQIGLSGLWAVATDEPGLAALLAGMTGREVDPRDVPAGPPTRPADLRELTMARDRLERELAEARARHEFYERTIAGRDAELRRARQLNAVLQATVRGRATVAVLYAVRGAKRRLWRRAGRSA